MIGPCPSFDPSRVYAYVDGERGEWANRMEAHMDECDRCRLWVSLEQALRGSVRRVLRDEPVPDGLEDRIREDIKGR